MQEKSYHKLLVYKKAKDLVLLVYKLTKLFPQEEKYSLVPQMRRAAISIMANIVEGYSKNSKKDFARFLSISIGSATELDCYIELCLDLNLITKINYENSFSLLLEVRKMLYSLQKSMRGGEVIIK